MIKCVIIDKDKTGRAEIEKCVAQFAHLTLVKSCATVAEAADAIKENKVDIIFLTVPPPIERSLDFLKFMKYEAPELVIISDQKKHAKEAFDYEAADFILKPVSTEKVAKAINKSVGTLASESDLMAHSNVLFVKDRRHYVKVSLKDIYMVEALSDYVNIYTKAKRFTVHATMKSMEKKLPGDQFARVHNSHIVRLDQIQEISKDTLMVQGTEIPISHTYKKALMERLKLV